MNYCSTVKLSSQNKSYIYSAPTAPVRRCQNNISVNITLHFQKRINLANVLKTIIIKVRERRKVCVNFGAFILFIFSFVLKVQ